MCKHCTYSKSGVAGPAQRPGTWNLRITLGSSLQPYVRVTAGEGMIVAMGSRCETQRDGLRISRQNRRQSPADGCA